MRKQFRIVQPCEQSPHLKLQDRNMRKNFRIWWNSFHTRDSAFGEQASTLEIVVSVLSTVGSVHHIYSSLNDVVC